MFYSSHKSEIKAFMVAAVGVAVVLGLILSLLPGAGDIWGWGRIAALLGVVFGYIYFIQYRALRKQEIQAKEIAQVKMLREISGGLFSNILEADITENRIIGENARKLAAMLGLQDNDSYDAIIDAIVAQLVREEFRQEYRRKFSRETIINLCMDNQPGFEYEFVERSDGVNYLWVRTYVRIYRSFDTGAVRIVSHVKNIQREKERELAIINRARRDPLTNVYNKAVTKELIDEFLVSEDGKEMHAFYLIDIDNFKDINDKFGHAVGDAVISELADRLGKIFRVSDIVGRIGGDEFLVLVKNVADRAVVSRKAQEICSSFQDMHESNGGRVGISVSVGICTLPEDGSSFDEIFVKADVALYAAKNSGKNTFAFYNEPLQQSLW